VLIETERFKRPLHPQQTIENRFQSSDFTFLYPRVEFTATIRSEGSDQDTTGRESGQDEVLVAALIPRAAT
jgi:hypothetical protein